MMNIKEAINYGTENNVKEYVVKSKSDRKFYEVYMANKEGDMMMLENDWFNEKIHSAVLDFLFSKGEALVITID